MARDVLRRLPAMGRLLDDPHLGGVIELYGRQAVRVQARQELDRLRQTLDHPATAEDLSETELAERTDDHVARLPLTIVRALEEHFGRPLQQVINATGIFVHTNLGRAPLPAEALSRALPLLAGYCDLEIDLATGERKDRNRRIGPLVESLCGAERTIVTNNNAGALVLALSALAAGREVILSRGEMVEIGGSFRIPEILQAAGCRLVEVGTTNRTRLDDYRRAVTENTALLLKVNPSNYRIDGFTEAVEPPELAALGRELSVPTLVDEGSGLLSQGTPPALRTHASIEQLIAADCDLVCASGDKILGGPQAGLLLGRRQLIERCQHHPLYRALRPGGFTYAVLETVLAMHARDEDLPIERLWPDLESHRQRLQAIADRLDGRIIDADAFVGGGSAPSEGITGPVIALSDRAALLDVLRLGEPSVMAYARANRLILDLRTVDPADDQRLVRAILRAREQAAPASD